MACGKARTIHIRTDGIHVTDLIRITVIVSKGKPPSIGRFRNFSGKDITLGFEGIRAVCRFRSLKNGYENDTCERRQEEAFRHGLLIGLPEGQAVEDFVRNVGRRETFRLRGRDVKGLVSLIRDLIF